VSTIVYNSKVILYKIEKVVDNLNLTKSNKKLLKRLALKHLIKDNSDERRKMDGLINIFTVLHNESGESGKDYYLFTGNDIEAVKRQLDRYIDIDGVQWNSMYDCTGRYFSSPIEVNVYKQANRILVGQSWGFDV
jgi:hypothetical protein